MRAVIAIVAIASALTAIGILLIFVLPSGGGVPLTVGLSNGETGHPLYVFVTTQRAIGFALIWLASMGVTGVIGRRFISADADTSMRTAKAVLVTSSAFAVIGFMLVFIINAVPTFTIGSFDRGRGMPLLLFVTTQRTVGFAFMWIATLLLAGVIGKRLTGSRLEY